MLTRLLISSLLCALLALWAWWLYLPVSPEAGLARKLLGERWYSLSLDDQHLGYWHTRNYRDEHGHWVFESEQRFAMQASDPVSTWARRAFEARPPHRLRSAEHLRRRRDAAEGIRIVLNNDGYEAARLPEDGTPTRRLDWQYTLADYLEFELWLDSERPEPGTSRNVTTLDFERADLVSRGFDVIAVDPSGYVVENAAPYSATRIRLDKRFMPEAMRLAGLFDLALTSREQALAPRSTLLAASYYVPIDRRLADHTRISRLVLAVQGHDAPAELFEGIERREGSWQMTLQDGPVSRGSSAGSHLEATVQFPSDHPDVAALARDAVAGLVTDQERARALTEFVHGYLEYRPGLPPRGVLALLGDRRGDCTEFADLLTTLARSLKMPARTVFGLAYADGPQPAFGYHAWNELHIDGSWRPVDPTWGQLQVDATHIPLPADEKAAMLLLTGAADLSFAVLEVTHLQD